MAAIIGAALGLGGSLGLGFVLGRRLRPCRRGMFWVASGGSLLLGMVILGFGQVIGATLLSGGGIGVMTGGLNGIRWGFGSLADARHRIPIAPGECDMPAAPQRPLSPRGVVVPEPQAPRAAHPGPQESRPAPQQPQGQPVPERPAPPQAPHPAG